MSNLGPQYINQTFGYLLQIPGGLTSTLTAVSDGNGNNLPFSASTTGITATITGGTVDNAIVGGTTAAAGSFTNLLYTGTFTGSAGILNIGSGQIYKDSSGNVGIGTTAGTTTVSSGLAINNATAANYPGLEIQTAGVTRFYINANNAASYLAKIGRAHV